MFLKSVARALPFAALFPAAAIAQATDEGAARLTGVFQSYLSATPGVVDVVPGGSGYELTIDLNPLIALIPDNEIPATVSPLTYSLSDLGGGKWRVTEDQAFSVSASAPGVMEFSMSVGSITSEGVWDEAIVAYESYSADLTDLATATKAFGPDGAAMTDDSSGFATMHYESTATAGASGGADSQIRYDATGYRQTTTIPAMPGAPPMQIELQADTYKGELSGTGFRSAAMLDVVAFFVANPSEAAVTAGQADLKDRLQTLLPVFDTLKGTVVLEDVTATSPIGPFAIRSINVGLDMNGAVADGRFRESIGLDGLVLPPGLVPDWGTSLVPRSALFDVEVSRFDLAAPAAGFIQAMDLSAAEPIDDATGMALLGKFMPEGLVDVTLMPGNVTGANYEVTFEGEMSAGPGQMPVGKGLVTATGLEQVQTALAAAPAEVSGQVLPMLGLAMSLAKPGADGSLEWEIDASTPGTLTVNGLDMMGMMGGP